MSIESEILKSLRAKKEIRTPIGTEIFLPNNSGIPHLRDRSIDFTIINPNSVWSTDTEIFIMWARAPLTITKIQVELDASTNQVAGDLKYADAFQSLANAVVINDFDTTSGKRTDTTITIGSVPEGKAIYLSFDSQPNSAIKQMHVHIEWRFN